MTMSARRRALEHTGFALLLALVVAGAVVLLVRVDGLLERVVTVAMVVGVVAVGAVWQLRLPADVRPLTFGPTLRREPVAFAVVAAVLFGAAVWVGVALLPRRDAALPLAGAAAVVWYANAAFGTRVSVRDGAIVVDNPGRRHVVPLERAAGIVFSGVGAAVRTRSGEEFPILAVRPWRQPTGWDMRRRAERLVTLADAQPARGTGPVVTTTRRWNAAVHVGAPVLALVGLLVGFAP